MYCTYYIYGYIYAGTYYTYILHIAIYTGIHAYIAILVYTMVQVEHWDSCEDFLEQLARKTGRLLKVRGLY